MSLDPEDFQRIQANLLELKNQNYALEDTCRKQKNALGEAQAKITVYEKELNNAQKIIAKSKKGQEVQQLYKDNESLQHKLRCQEDEFRMQNQTLLEELSKLVTNNEKLEARIRLLNEGSSDEIAIELRKEITDLQKSRQSIEEEKKALQKENDALRATSKGGNQEPKVLSNDTSTVKVDAQLGVSFKKINSDPATPPKQPLISSTPSDNIDWKSKCVELQELVAQYQDKIEITQKEIETQKNDFRQKFESLRDEKDHEIFNLREQSQKLQVQLNNGFSGFKDFKEKKAKEIQGLQDKIQDLSKNDQNEAFEKLETQLQNSNGELEDLKSEKSRLVQEIQEYVAKLNDEAQIRCALNKEIEDLKHELDEATKTCESRKKLLDEMAIHIQTKTCETDEAVEKVNKELILHKSTIQERDIEIQGLKEDIENLKSKETNYISKINDLESKEAELDIELNQIKTKSQQQISEIKESCQDELKIFKAENEIVLRDLNMQLEIANAQKSEFEETVEQLKQEMKDQLEERKIGDKKGQALIKDLKKQLFAEKTRNEKLSEKMKEATFNVTENPANSNFSEVSKSECTDADRTSNSSWSIYSGQNDNASQRIESNEHSPSPELASSLPNSNVTNPLHTDFGAMVEKLSGLEEEKWSLQQKVQMLEISAAAMADDLVKKSNIIQFYCMEGKQDHVKKESVAQSPADKIKNVKKVMNALVHPDQLEAQQKEELQRMQRMLEETLTKNMHLQKDLEHLSQEVVRLSKLVVPTN